MALPAAGLPLDALGVAHPPHPGARIASLVPSVTETLFALGLGSHVLARTGFCIKPEPQVRVVPKVGGTKDVLIEKLLATRPTHVIVDIDENRRETYEVLRQRVPNVIVLRPVRPEDVVDLLRLLGHAFGVEAAAGREVSRLLAALDRTRAFRRERGEEQVLCLIWRKPWMTVSRDTYASRMLAEVGWQTVPAVSDTRYPVLAEDAGAWRQARRWLLTTEPYPFTSSDVERLASQDEAPQCSLLDGEMLTWYGARTATALEYLLQRHAELAASAAR